MRIEDDAGLLAKRLDQLHRAVRMRPSFGMEGNDVRACVGKILHILIDRRNHQMDVEGLGTVRAQRLHHSRPDRDIGDEMAVHHIDMDPVASSLVNRANLLTQAGEIGG